MPNKEPRHRFREEVSQSSGLLTLSYDMFNIVAEYCHGLDLARLSLCSKELLVICESVASLLCRYRFTPPSRPADSTAMASDRSWCYRYLMATETASVKNDKLRSTLTELYTDDPHASKLNLYGLGIGDDDVGHLALALRVAQNVKLGLINLGGNDIGDAGVRELMRGVEPHLSEIDTISLVRNRIGEKGARCLADLLARSSHLRNLSLSENPITDEGARVIGSALPASSLATLSLRSMSFSVSARESIRTVWGMRGCSYLGLYL